MMQDNLSIQEYRVMALQRYGLSPMHLATGSEVVGVGRLLLKALSAPGNKQDASERPGMKVAPGAVMPCGGEIGCNLTTAAATEAASI